MEKYDVFISYRRDGGETTARIIRDALRERGYRVFFDVESLRSGNFNDALLETIRQCKDFLLICSPHALDRCVNEGDWVRRELLCALENKKKVIPIMLQGFSFPKPGEVFPETEAERSSLGGAPTDVKMLELPDAILKVSEFNGVAPSQAHFSAYIDKLCTFLTSKISVRGFIISLLYNGRRTAVAALLVLLAIAGGGGLWRLAQNNAVFPYATNEKQCVNRLLSCTAQILGHYNSALDAYGKALNELEAYCKGESIKQYQEFEGLAQNAIDNLINTKSGVRSIDEMDATLLSDLSKLKVKLNAGDINVMSNAIVQSIEIMIDELRFQAAFYTVNEGATPELLRSIQNAQTMMELDRDGVFYTVNEMLLPVTNKETIAFFQTEYLSEMSHLYVAQTWVRDEAELKAVNENIDRRIKNCLAVGLEMTGVLEEKYEISISAAQEYDEAELLYDNSEEFTSGMRTSEKLQILLNRANLLLAKYALEYKLRSVNSYTTGREIEIDYQKRIDEMKSNGDKISTLLSKTIAREEEAYQKFKPLETDELDVLWGKAVRFISIKMMDAAELCFDMYNEKADSNQLKLVARKAGFFASKMDETNVTGGVIVALYEEGLPKQAVEIGDIIYTCNNQPVKTYDEYGAAKEGMQTVGIQILRFADDGAYELLEGQIDSALGRIGLLPLGE